MTPPKVGAKEFEELLMLAAKRATGIHMVRYGTQSSIGADGKPMAVQSLPDFDGAFAPNGQQFIIEAKVCAQASFPMTKDKLKPRQVRHLLERSRVGVRSFVIIHFCERIGKNFHEPGETRAFAVNDRDPRWQAFVDAHAEAKRTGNPVVPQGSINRDLAVRISKRVEWTCPPGCRKPLPDLAALLGIQPAQPSLF